MPFTSRSFHLIGSAGLAGRLSLVLGVSAGAQSGTTAQCPNKAQPPVSGTESDDTLNGTSGADRILAGAGDDVVDTLQGNDCVHGGDGFDEVQGPIRDGLDLRRGRPLTT